MSRLPEGGLIDRTRPLAFRFDGRAYQGFAGDTLASALVANGVRLVGRSFKYHRPRGLLTAGPEEPSGLVTVGLGAAADPNTRATTAELHDGLTAASQNRWPCLRFDAMAVNSLLSPIFVAGFYYKTFMWPAAFWEKLYEPAIRRAAGLGRLSGAEDPATYDKAHAFCDLLVIGAGPAGLAAALAAGRAGARVILCEDDFEPGGRLLAEREDVAGAPARDWVRSVVAELESFPRVRIFRRTTLFGVYDGGVYGALERVADHLPSAPPGLPRQRLWKIAARHSVLATGAVERPIVFGGNDRPGVMTASAVRTYANRFAAVPGRRICVFTTGDDGWRTARDLIAAGVTVEAVIDARREVPDRLLLATARAGTRIFLGGCVTATRGHLGLKGIEVRDAAGRRHRLAADALALAGGWNPAIGLGCNLGARPVWSEDAASFLLQAPPPGMALAGAAAGHFSTAGALAGGIAAAGAAVAALGLPSVAVAVPAADDEEGGGMPLWRVEGSKGKAFVDFQHDVTDKDIALGAREGYVSVEHLKRYTTLGMATDQGKTSNVNGHALLAQATGRTLAETGTILSRPPYLPVAIGALAGGHRGAHFRPERRTASHDWAAAQGAAFVDAGAWKRAQWYAREGEGDWLATVSREVRTVRGGVGFCDVSTLGKIDVQGPDAGTFLDRLYINGFSGLPVGKARYGVMLREDGFVMDDGTTSRLGPEHYVVTTTTANAAKVMQHMEHARQVLWPDLDVQTVSVTEQWAQYSVAGPKSRALLQALLGGAADLSDAAVPYMAVREVEWRGIPARLFRLSFSGELAYEVAVPARHGEALARDLLAAGADLGVAPYGTEALGVMRIEKGHPAGNELSGQTTAYDLGLGRMMSAKKDFIGRVMAQRPALSDPARPRLVGLRPLSPADRLRGGAHLLAPGAAEKAGNDQGYVTSVAFSPELGHWIALALLKHGPERLGERLRAYDPVRGGDVAVEVCSPVFVDPEGVRVRG